MSKGNEILEARRPVASDPGRAIGKSALGEETLNDIDSHPIAKQWQRFRLAEAVLTPAMQRRERSYLARTAFRLFYGNSTERATSNNAFAHFHGEQLMVYKPGLFITYLKKLRVEFGTGPAAYA